MISPITRESDEVSIDSQVLSTWKKNRNKTIAYCDNDCYTVTVPLYSYKNFNSVFRAPESVRGGGGKNTVLPRFTGVYATKKEKRRNSHSAQVSAAKNQKPQLQNSVRFVISLKKIKKFNPLAERRRQRAHERVQWHFSKAAFIYIYKKNTSSLLRLCSPIVPSGFVHSNPVSRKTGRQIPPAEGSTTSRSARGNEKKKKQNDTESPSGLCPLVQWGLVSFFSFYFFFVPFFFFFISPTRRRRRRRIVLF